MLVTRKQLALILSTIFLSLFIVKAYANCDLVIGTNKVNISLLDKVDVLQALHKRAFPRELACVRGLIYELTGKEIRDIFESSENKFFDYVDSRPMKVDLSGDVLDTTDFNELHGEGAAEQAICAFFHESIHYPSSSENEASLSLMHDLGGACLFP